MSYFARIYRDACHKSGIVTIYVIFVPQAQSDHIAVYTATKILYTYVWKRQNLWDYKQICGITKKSLGLWRNSHICLFLFFSPILKLFRTNNLLFLWKRSNTSHILLKYLFNKKSWKQRHRHRHRQRLGTVFHTSDHVLHPTCTSGTS